jgi:hypothetical protein
MSLTEILLVFSIGISLLVIGMLFIIYLINKVKQNDDIQFPYRNNYYNISKVSKNNNLKINFNQIPNYKADKSNFLNSHIGTNKSLNTIVKHNLNNVNSQRFVVNTPNSNIASNNRKSSNSKPYIQKSNSSTFQSNNLSQNFQRGISKHNIYHNKKS